MGQRAVFVRHRKEIRPTMSCSCHPDPPCFNRRVASGAFRVQFTAFETVVGDERRVAPPRAVGGRANTWLSQGIRSAVG